MSDRNQLNATVVSKTNINDELVVLRFKPDDGVAEYKAGQYVAVGLPGDAARIPDAQPEAEIPAPDKLIKRVYSLSSNPHERDTLEIFFVVLKFGALTSRLGALKVGDRLWAAKKITGEFHCEGVPSESELVLVGTGTGLAPYISMLRDPTTWENPQRKVVLVHGVRYPKDLAFQDEISKLKASGKNINYIPVVSRGGAEWRGVSGHVQVVFESGTVKLNSLTQHVFLCGNPAMVTAMEGMLSAAGFTEHSRKVPGNLHVEKYW
jgi:ferredoxin--NADP+ reductase